ncbi:hypothetical protein C8J27_10444 [Rhodobacter aestuarii]|uniref:Uncharacterized protein n=1 Tax=Rhodobacter aestuarii TaxID=453582 RepID=A0A1N7L3L5_9RHOB|nr:hypothetical protein [Rhodobacter aestuarii]PTV95409.1 hypothetical protein C8J27_10444 [Rhodobacter aestuarii]SIS68270.1 hypothetical protein SAMN05421580_103210 [Rhodobacter aestuarii]
MTALAFSRLSKIAPDPWHVAHPGAGNIGYTCHMAAMHWAQMALGASQMRANEIVGVFTRLHCPGCKANGSGVHTSVSTTAYGHLFCRRAVLIPDRNSLHGMVEVGDVLIAGLAAWPMHTMVLRQKRGAGHITVRGFNNLGTLGTGERDRYDPVSHNITQDKYWKDPAAGLFGRSAAPLCVVRHADFMEASRMLRDEAMRTGAVPAH